MPPHPLLPHHTLLTKGSGTEWVVIYLFCFLLGVLLVWAFLRSVSDLCSSDQSQTRDIVRYAAVTLSRSLRLPPCCFDRLCFCAANNGVNTELLINSLVYIDPRLKKKSVAIEDTNNGAAIYQTFARLHVQICFIHNLLA